MNIIIIISSSSNFIFINTSTTADQLVCKSFSVSSFWLLFSVLFKFFFFFDFECEIFAQLFSAILRQH